MWKALKNILLYGLAAVGGALLVTQAADLMQNHFSKIGNINKLRSKYPGKWAIVFTANNTLGIAYVETLLSINYSVLIVGIDQDIDVNAIQKQHTNQLISRSIKLNDIKHSIDSIFAFFEKNDIGIAIFNTYDFAPYSLINATPESIEKSMSINAQMGLMIYDKIREKAIISQSRMLVVHLATIAIKPKWVYFGTYSAGQSLTEAYINRLHKMSPSLIDSISLRISLNSYKQAKKNVRMQLENAGINKISYGCLDDQFQDRYWNHKYLSEQRYSICKMAMRNTTSI